VIERFRTLSSARQFGAALLGALVLALVLALLWAAMRTSYRPLFTGLKSSDAATIVAELDRRKADYRLTDGGTTILVPAEKVDTTRLELMNQNLALKGVVGFELFNKSDLGLTDFAQRINYQRALQGELERTIMSLDGVDGARVHLSLGEDRLFRADRVAPKASVTLHMHSGVTIEPKVAGGVQRLVAAAVPQLQPSDVVILDEKGEVIAADSFGGASVAQDEQQAVGQFYAARIRAALKPVLGDALRVEVTAALPAGSDGGDVASLLDPRGRGFPLSVTLASGGPLDPTVRQQAENATAQAIGFDAGKGDTISFELAAAPARSHATYTPTPTAEPTTDAGAGLLTGLPAAYGWGFAALLGLGAAVALLARGRGQRRLSEEERARVAARLAALVEQEGSHHASAG
jgi:flagellar M-ring protein FliF